ncbi:hypothetical protein ABIB44_000188 [Hymenobacter sp. UYCo722]
MPVKYYKPSWMKRLPDGIHCSAWIPGNCSKEEVLAALAGQYQDLGLDMLTYISKRWMNHENDPWGDAKMKGGYVALYGADLKANFGNPYKAVLDALIAANILQVWKLRDITGQEELSNSGSYKTKKHDGDYGISKAYRVRLDLLGEGTNEWKQEQFLDMKAIFNIWQREDSKRKKELVQEARRRVLEMSDAVCRQYDLVHAKSILDGLYKAHKYAEGDVVVNGKKLVTVLDGVVYIDNVTVGRKWVQLNGIVEMPWQGNSCDQFGERFHGPFTNMNSVLRPAIRIAGESCVNIDIRNSQFALLACLMTANVLPILTEKAQDNPTQVANAIATLQAAYVAHEDVRLFCQYALAGQLYAWVAGELGISEAEAKQSLFRCLFSGSKEGLTLKKKLLPLLPNLVAVCGELNDGEQMTIIWKTKKAASGRLYSQQVCENKENMLPFLMQRLEARILIDRVAVEAVADPNVGEFVTIHDSFICRPKDRARIKQLFYGTLEMLGLPKLVTKDEGL